MNINQLTDKCQVPEIEVKVIYLMNPNLAWGTQTLVVIDKDAGESGNETAFLDLSKEEINTYQVGDFIKAVNCYCKIINTKQGPKKTIVKGSVGKYLRC